MTPKEFDDLVRPLVEFIGKRELNPALQAALNEAFPASGPYFLELKDACQAAIRAGWMCKYEAGGIRYGRVVKPRPDLLDYSIDVVAMEDVVGPHHRHPNGEIDLIMPLSEGAEFDKHGAGFLVYGPGTAHHPTVTGGRALVMYLLPAGAIEFTNA